MLETQNMYFHKVITHVAIRYIKHSDPTKFPSYWYLYFVPIMLISPADYLFRIVSPASLPFFNGIIYIIDKMLRVFVIFLLSSKKYSLMRKRIWLPIEAVAGLVLTIRQSR